MESEVRELNDYEVKILDGLDVSSETKAALKREWEHMPMGKVDPVDSKEIKKYTLSAQFLSPLMILVLAANLAYGLPLLAKLSTLVVVLVWALYIFLCSLGVFAMAVLVASKSISPLNQGLVALYKSKNNAGVIYRFYNFSCNIALVSLLALNGYLVVAVMMATVLLAMRLVVFLARVRVRVGLDQLMKTA